MHISVHTRYGNNVIKGNKKQTILNIIVTQTKPRFYVIDVLSLCDGRRSDERLNSVNRKRKRNIVAHVFNDRETLLIYVDC